MRRTAAPVLLASVLTLVAACASGAPTNDAGSANDTGAVSTSAAGVPSGSTGAPTSASPARSTLAPTPRATAKSSPTHRATPTRTATRTGSTQPPATTAQNTATSGVSWNPHVVCKPVITTMRAVLGTQKNARGGATFNGGAFKPGIPDRRSTNPPCSVAGKPTLVELHHVVMGSCSKINNDGDWTCELTDPAIPLSAGVNMRQIHCEIDGNYRAKGWAPKPPPGGVFLDVQGFVFWDPGHETAAWHHYSGWELHSFTAWRLAR
jgi:hypothetical protein